MIFVTNPENYQEGSIPRTGEWIFSPEPRGFTICLENNTGLLPGNDRVVLHCLVGDQAPSATNPGHWRSVLRLVAVTSINECAPGDSIPQSQDTKDFFLNKQKDIADAINGWNEALTQEQKELLWEEAAASRHDPLELLEQIFSGKFTA